MSEKRTFEERLGEKVRRNLYGLPVRHQMAIVLYCAGYTLPEIGKIFGVSKQAVHKWMQRATKELARRPRIPLRV